MQNTNTRSTGWIERCRCAVQCVALPPWCVEVIWNVDSRWNCTCCDCEILHMKISQARAAAVLRARGAAWSLHDLCRWRRARHDIQSMFSTLTTQWTFAATSCELCFLLFLSRRKAARNVCAPARPAAMFGENASHSILLNKCSCATEKHKYTVQFTVHCNDYSFIP